MNEIRNSHFKDTFEPEIFTHISLNLKSKEKKCKMTEFLAKAFSCKLEECDFMSRLSKTLDYKPN